MITPSDYDYQQVKLLKKKGGSPSFPFRELTEWIALHYEVNVLDVHYDMVIPDDCPRLNVILEWKRDEIKFRDGFNFDRDKQENIRMKFLSLISGQTSKRFKTDGLFVIFSAFESVARIEANEKVTENDLEILKQQLDNPALWMISRLFDGVTFFFYTDAQSQACEKKGLKKTYAEEYARFVAQYDEFGYLAMSGVFVNFDSKENFDTNYQSNWYYYYK